MKKLKRSECAILPLVLKGKWYDMIESGKKLEEYRDCKPYWNRRINNWWYYKHGVRVVEFRLGYKKDTPKMWFEASEVFFRQAGRTYTWGEPTGPHFAIALGERVEIERGATA